MDFVCVWGGVFCGDNAFCVHEETVMSVLQLFLNVRIRASFMEVRADNVRIFPVFPHSPYCYKGQYLVS